LEDFGHLPEISGHALGMTGMHRLIG